MTLLRGILILLGAGFLGACVWAYLSGDFAAEFAAITGLPWGKISLADLYLGFLVIAVVIFFLEPLWISLPVIIVMMLLGNWVSAFWLAARLPKLVRKLRGVA